MRFSRRFLAPLFLVIGASIIIAGSSTDGPTRNKFREREATDDSLSYPNLYFLLLILVMFHLEFFRIEFSKEMWLLLE